MKNRESTIGLHPAWWDTETRNRCVASGCGGRAAAARLVCFELDRGPVNQGGVQPLGGASSAACFNKQNTGDLQGRQLRLRPTKSPGRFRRRAQLYSSHFNEYQTVSVLSRIIVIIGECCSGTNRATCGKSLERLVRDIVSK